MAARDKINMYKENGVSVPFELIKKSITEMLNSVSLSDYELSQIDAEIKSIYEEKQSVLSEISGLSDEPKERFSKVIDYIYYNLNKDGISDSNYSVFYHLTTELMSILPSFYTDYGNEADIELLERKVDRDAKTDELYKLYTAYLYRLWLVRTPRKATFSKTYGIILQLFSIIREINYRKIE